MKMTRRKERVTAMKKTRMTTKKMTKTKTKTIQTTPIMTTTTISLKTDLNCVRTLASTSTPSGFRRSSAPEFTKTTCTTQSVVWSACVTSTGRKRVSAKAALAAGRMPGRRNERSYGVILTFG